MRRPPVTGRLITIGVRGTLAQPAFLPALGDVIDAVGQFISDLAFEGVDVLEKFSGKLLDEFERPLVADRARREVVVPKVVRPRLVAGFAKAILGVAQP